MTLIFLAAAVAVLILATIWTCLRIASMNDRLNEREPYVCPDCGAHTWLRNPETGLPERHVCK